MTDDQIERIFRQHRRTAGITIEEANLRIGREIERAVLAEQAEPVAFVPRCIKDCQYGVVGEFRWNELDENPFDVSNPEEWECAKLYTNPPTAPAEPKPPSTPKE